MLIHSSRMASSGSVSIIRRRFYLVVGMVLPSTQALHKRDHPLRYVRLRLRREGRCARLVAALGKGLRGRQVAKPAIGIPEIKGVREGRLVAHGHRDLAEI